MTLALREIRFLSVPRRAYRAVKSKVATPAPVRVGYLKSWQSTMEFGADLIISQIR